MSTHKYSQILCPLSLNSYHPDYAVYSSLLQITHIPCYNAYWRLTVVIHTGLLHWTYNTSHPSCFGWIVRWKISLGWIVLRPLVIHTRTTDDWTVPSSSSLVPLSCCYLQDRCLWWVTVTMFNCFCFLLKASVCQIKNKHKWCNHKRWTSVGYHS